MVTMEMSYKIYRLKTGIKKPYLNKSKFVVNYGRRVLEL